MTKESKKQTVKKTKKLESKGQEVMKRIETTPAQESKKMLIIVISIILILGIFYLIVSLVKGQISLPKSEDATIQYSEILAGSTFKQSDEEYVVIYYDFTKEDASDYVSLVSTYISNTENPKLYTVDLSRKFNTSYLRKDDESINKEATTAKELKLNDPTLIKIKDKKIIDYIESYEEIKNYMS